MPFFVFSFTFVTSDAGDGAPPPPTARSDDVSYFANAGELTRSQLCVGTPTKLVIFSRSMISRAFSASHLYMITSFKPTTKQLIITGTQPVTWKSGTMRMNDGGRSGPSTSFIFTPAAASTALRAENDMIEEITARCVDTAPFGRPVVPLV